IKKSQRRPWAPERSTTTASHGRLFPGRKTLQTTRPGWSRSVTTWANVSETRKRIMAEHPRITLDPEVMVGKPVIRGTRITVELIIGLLAQGWTEQDILTAYPHLTREDILACLAYAQECAGDRKVYPIAAA